MDPQNSGPDCILYRDLEVFNLHRKSLLQHAVVCRDLFPMLLLGFRRDSILFFSIFIMSRLSFLCHDRSFFGSLTICLAKSAVLTVLCCDNLMCGSMNSYVATSTIFLSRQSYCAASSNWCRDQFFMTRQHFCFGSCCNNVSYIVRIYVATKKVCCDRVLSPLNLISFYSFILMLRHGLLV